MNGHAIYQFIQAKTASWLGLTQALELLMKIFGASFLILCTVCACSRRSDDKGQILFAPKAFFDSDKRTVDGGIYIAGTLTGEGIYYKDNSVAVSCNKDEMKCSVYEVDSIGPNQIGRLDTPDTYNIVNWGNNEIIASDYAGDLFSCRKNTITIVRSTENAVWVQEPINQTSPRCLKSDTRVLKWTIEDPPRWKELNESK